MVPLNPLSQSNSRSQLRFPFPKFVPMNYRELSQVTLSQPKMKVRVGAVQAEPGWLDLQGSVDKDHLPDRRSRPSWYQRTRIP